RSSRIGQRQSRGGTRKIGSLNDEQVKRAPRSTAVNERAYRRSTEAHLAREVDRLQPPRDNGECASGMDRRERKRGERNRAESRRPRDAPGETGAGFHARQRPIVGCIRVVEACRAGLHRIGESISVLVLKEMNAVADKESVVDRGLWII